MKLKFAINIFCRYFREMFLMSVYYKQNNSIYKQMYKMESPSYNPCLKKMVIESLLNLSSYKLNYNSIEINNKKLLQMSEEKKNKQKEHANVTTGYKIFLFLGKK